jgi:hypothetical protein
VVRLGYLTTVLDRVPLGHDQLIEKLGRRHYPLTRADVRRVMHQGHSIEELAVRFLDEILILPELGHLYDEAAEWLDAPELRTLMSPRLGSM